MRLLDLSGCYNLLSIPEEISKMPNLKIKIRNYVSDASTVVFIPVPGTEITPSVFSIIFSIKKRKIEQFIIHQISPHYSQPEPFELPDGITEFQEMKLLSIQGKLSSLPFSIQNLHRLTSIYLSYCSTLVSLPDSICNLSNLISLNLSECYNIGSLPDNIGNLSKLASLTLNSCWKLMSLPESIGNLFQLTALDLSRCYNLGSLPDSIGNLSKLTLLNLSDCYNLGSLPDTIGNLSNLTSLDLNGCSHLASLPISAGNLTHITTALSIFQVFTIPSDLDWDQFQKNVTVPLYLDYMMRMNKIGSITSSVLEYIKRFDVKDDSFMRYRISEVYGLIERRREGGGDLIKHFCSMLTNAGVRGSGYLNRILEWASEEKKKDGMECLKILYLYVHGTGRRRELHHRTKSPVSKERRMRVVWMVGGKDSEWRTASDIIREEDTLQTFYLSLCVQATVENARSWNIPSKCSLIAMHALRYDGIGGYHFRSYPSHSIPHDSVVVRITPWSIHTADSLKWHIASLLLSDATAERRGKWIYTDLSYNTPYLVLKMKSRKDARMLVERMNGRECDGLRLSLTQGKQNLLRTFISSVFS